MTNETKQCQNCKKDFVIELDDFSFYEKIKVPPPTFCPECRLIRRLARRNERTFHHSSCEKCGKKIISIFSKESKVHIYCSYCWASDAWDGVEYGVDFDSSKNFISQLNDLFLKVPIMNLYGLHTTKTNSDYTNMVSWVKNCYMITYGDYNENLIYGSFVNHSKDSNDNLMGNQLELCYETVNCNKCYRTFFSTDCENCADIWFSKNCVGCNNCFGCVNLRSKNYYIFNEKYTKENFEEKIKEFSPLTSEKLSEINAKSKKIWLSAPQKFMHGWRNFGSSGDYLTDTKNAKDCFIGFNFEDSRYCGFITGKMTDSYDFINFGEASSLIYESLQAGNQVSNIKMSHWAISNCDKLDYCLFCENSHNLFGCVGLKKKEYCILNKQYTKEQYEELVPKIIKQMNDMPYIDKKGNEYRYGEFFPIEICPFAYNETTAQEYFPLTKEEALSNGYKWAEKEERKYNIDIKNENIPDNIEETTDEIVNKVIECLHKGECVHQCTEAFKIIPEELQFYKRFGLPIPHLCPNCRHYERLQQRNPMKLWHRKCMREGCNNEFETSYSPERREIVYCEKCYQQEVF
jgi:hypothetical protein